MNKKKITRLQLSKETLRNLSERDLQTAAGGMSRAATCPTGVTDCFCISDDSCPPTHPDC